MLKSKLFWTSFLLCLIAFSAILFYRINQQPQEPIKIYNTIKSGQQNMSQISNKATVQTDDKRKEIDAISTPANSVAVINLEDTPFSEVEVQSEKSISSNTESKISSTSEPEDRRFFGLTLDEIEQQIPVLEQEIRTNLTMVVELYTELRSTDGLAAKSAEIAAWREKTWNEVKKLFNDVSRTGKIIRYTSYLRLIGEEQNPTLPGGWIFELIKPLPMRITVGNATENSISK